MSNFKKNIFIGFLIILAFSCGQNVEIKKDISTNDTLSQMETGDNSATEDETQTFYLVQVAEGHNYDSLCKISSETALILNSKVDMMGRIYNPNKGIVLPDSCDDDMYCGAYYPRRPFGDQTFVSIEMQYAFDGKKKWTNRDTLQMIVLSNMFETKSSADSVVNILRSKIKTAHTITQDIYLGCMH